MNKVSKPISKRKFTREEMLNPESIYETMRTAYFNRANEIHEERFEYLDLDPYYRGEYTPIYIRCKKHNWTFKILAISHLEKEDGGCIFCSKEMTYLPQEEVLYRFKLIHGDKYDYSQMDYKDCRTKIKIICPKHGEFYQTPHNHMLGQRCVGCLIEALKRKKEM